jgi:hypothetical protein
VGRSLSESYSNQDMLQLGDKNKQCVIEARNIGSLIARIQI